MRIVSLLPSATEIVYALGLEAQLVGVTHECDWPQAARSKQVVSFSALPPSADPAEIDRLVSASIGDGRPIYGLDREAMARLRPDVVLTQDLCAVCAVPAGHVTEALGVLGCDAEVVSLDPTSLDDVLSCITEVADRVGVPQRGAGVVGGLQQRLAEVVRAVDGLARPATFALEWPDPPFNGGHWVPEMIEAAGGRAVLGSPGAPSARITWDAVAHADPQVTVFMPCGYDLNGAVAVAGPALGHLPSTTAVYAVDASAYFSRPGPRLVDGVELLAAILHPDRCGAPPAGRCRRLR